MPKVIQNSTIVYGIGLATVAPLFAWGVGGEFWPAIVYVGFVGLGLSLIYVLRRPLLEFLAGALSHDRSITVHEFIARRHGNDPRVAAVAAALTVFAARRLPRLRDAWRGHGAQAAAFGQRRPRRTFYRGGLRGRHGEHVLCRAYRDNARGSTSNGSAIFWTVRSDCVSVVSSGFGTRVNAGAGHHCDGVHPHRGRDNLFPQACPIC